jgi:hypothetical protein
MKCVLFALVAVAASASVLDNGARVNAYTDGTLGRAFYTFLGDMLPEMNQKGLDESYAVYDASTLTAAQRIIINGKTYDNGVLAGKSGGKIDLTYHLGNQFKSFHYCIGAKRDVCTYDVQLSGTSFSDDSKVVNFPTLSYNGGDAVCTQVDVTNIGTITISSAKGHPNKGCQLVIADATLVEDPEVDCIEVARETVMPSSQGATSYKTHARWYQQNGFHINGRSFTSGVFAIGASSNLLYAPADLSHKYQSITGFVGEDDYSDGKAGNPTYKVVVYDAQGKTLVDYKVDTSGQAPYSFDVSFPAAMAKFALVTMGGVSKTKTAWVQTKYCTDRTLKNDCVWGKWSKWGAGTNEKCAACGPSIETSTRKIKKAARNGGKACTGPSFRHRACKSQPACDVKCQYSKWTSVVQCPKCGPGTQLEVREVILGDPAKCTDYQRKTTCADKACPQDCKVSGWSDWMVEQKAAKNALDQLSSATCHQTDTQMYRKRVVIQKQTCDYSDAKADKHCGRACPTLIEERSVGIGRCPVDCVYTYEPVGTCSAQCGGGYQRKEIKITTKQMFGGKPCPVEDQWERCNTEMCERDCKMGKWEAWLPCDRTCGKGQQIRYRHEVAPAQAMKCSKSTIETRSCDNGPCPLDCVVTTWSPWSLCEATCGNRAAQVRARTIHAQPSANGLACPHLEERKNCAGSNVACPVDCEYSEWGDWSKCTETCGSNGVQWHARRVTQLGVGALACPAKKDRLLNQTRACNRIHCPQDCEVGEWENTWSECSKNLATGTQCHTAAQASTQMRSRPVIKASLWGGAKCPALTEHRRCTEAQGVYQCKSDCQLGDWSGWSQCSNTCKDPNADATKYTQERRRAIVIEAKHGGSCLEDRFESRSCAALLEDCPTKCTVSTQYPAWDDVTCVTPGGGCGLGLKTRTRTVTQGNGAYDLSCPATQETRSCVNKMCAQTCLYSPWSAKQCVQKSTLASTMEHHACGAGGVYVQTRTLLREGRNADGSTKACNYLVKELAGSCNDKPCPIDCDQVADGWTECSKSCGTGFKTRTYKVKADAAHGGQECAEAKSSVCNTKPCPQPCKVGPWSDPLEETFTLKRKRVTDENDNEYVKYVTPAGMSKKGYAHCRASKDVDIYKVQERVVIFNAIDTTCDKRLVKYSLATLDEVPVCDHDCTVSEWSAWSKCSVTCGGNMHLGTGLQTRTRKSTNNGPITGMKCPALSEDRACNHQQCPIDCAMAPWSAWSKCMNKDNSFTDCSRSADDTETTFQIRWRSKLVQEQFGGTCTDNMSEKQACKDVDGCKDTAEMGPWSKWSKCTGKCGHGTRRRTRKCNPKNLKSEEWKTCAATEMSEACVAACDCELSDWKADDRGCFHTDQYGHYEHTTCSYAKGSGFAAARQTETRKVLNAPNKAGKSCRALLKETGEDKHILTGAEDNVYIGLDFASKLTECSHLKACPINCEYSSTWANEGTCVDPSNGRKCGDNTFQTRKRKIGTHSNNVGNAISCASQPTSKIVGDYEQISVRCNRGPCPKDCEVGDWEVWMPCDRTCNSKMGGAHDPRKPRSREVLKRRIITLAQHGGQCPHLVETKFDCAASKCPVDCIMSPWSSYGKCNNKKCAQTRTRKIIQQADGGKSCPDLLEDDRKCNSHLCHTTSAPTKAPTKKAYKEENSRPGEDNQRHTDTPTPKPTWAPTYAPTKFGGNRGVELGDRLLTCNDAESAKMDCTDNSPYKGYSKGNGVEKGQVCRSSTDSCNLCKCTSGGEVQCQNKNCDNHERPGTSGVNPTYQTCDATKCTFEYKGSSNKRSKYEFDAKSKSWKENKNHDDGKFDPNDSRDVSSVKFLKVIHDGVEDKGSHHFCAYNLQQRACECKCWTPEAACKDNKVVARANDFDKIKGQFKCSDKNGKVAAHSTRGTCKWESPVMKIQHDVDVFNREDDHGYDALRVKFQYREKGSLDRNDYAKVELRVCATQDESSCGKFQSLKKLYNDIDKSRKNQQAKRWSNWRTFNSNYKNILDGDQYVQVQVALNADHRDYQQIQSVEVRSECH